jgi:dTDP-4-dehydrorhamnose 3,5-epimerase
MTQLTIFTPRRFSDSRGWFSETYNQKRLKDYGLDIVFVQDNQSLSTDIGTIRGLHFQAHPHAQGKLIRVLSGSIMDVAVDIRRGSPTFGQALTMPLSAEDGQQFYIPAGYAHGFATLEPHTVVLYKVTAFYDQASEGGVRWNDPDLAIAWGLGARSPVVSDKDAVLPIMADFETPFAYDGVPMELVEF